MVTSPAGAPADAYIAMVGAYETLFSDNFETNLGWTVVNSGLTDGAWNRGTPAGSGDRGDPTHDGDGSGQCYLTDNVDGNSDVDGGSTSLVSPAIDLSDGDAVIGFYYWYSNSTGDEPQADVFEIDISNNNGSNWTNALTVGPDGAGSFGGWFYHEFVVSDFTTPTSQMKIRFTASDLAGGSIVEAAVDGVTVRRFDCVGCVNNEDCDDGEPCNGLEQCLDGECLPGPITDCNGNDWDDSCDVIAGGDFDADGDVDLEDYQAMLDAMAGPNGTPAIDPAECLPVYLAAFDFDGDLDVDLDDFANFQAAFN